MPFTSQLPLFDFDTMDRQFHEIPLEWTLFLPEGEAWTPEIGKPCLIYTMMAYCDDTKDMNYCYYEQCIITDIISNGEYDADKVVICKVDALKGYYKNGYTFRVPYFDVIPNRCYC